MTLKDFFHLSEEEFAERISKMTDEELMKDDIHNCRTTHSGAYAAAIGAAQAPLTNGVSLVGTAIGLRRMNVAQRRLDMIREELIKRGLPIHRQTKRDYLIPLGMASISGAVSGGVFEGAMSAMPILNVAETVADTAVAGVAQAAEEFTGRLAVEEGVETVMEMPLPGTGRSVAWAEKLKISRSASQLRSMLRLPEADCSKLAISAPTSPLLKGIENDRPPLPPRPSSSVGLVSGIPGDQAVVRYGQL